MVSVADPVPDGAVHEEAEGLVSVVIPCLNEEQNIDGCVRAAQQGLSAAGLRGEVIVVDNDSEDRSAALAAAAGATVLHEPRRGYGSAYLAGLAAAKGDYVVMADADLTYDFADIPRFVEKLAAGADMVIGDRMDNIEPGAMPWLHRYIGNPMLTGILNLFFRTGVRDAHCGMRAVRREAIARLDLRTTGMEFASEMVVGAAREGLVIDELPIKYHPRGGESKLSSFRDGWRHLRYLLVHSPVYLFLLPGALMAVLGLVLSITVLANLSVFGRQWYLHTEIAGTLLLVVGVQVIAMGLCAQAYATYYLGHHQRWFDVSRSRFRLEQGLMAGSLIAVAGLAVVGAVAVRWIGRHFGPLDEEGVALVGATLVIIGVQVFFTSFLLSILGLHRSDERALTRPRVPVAPPGSAYDDRVAEHLPSAAEPS
ncbi:MAG: glycosyltransferase family 2 protein [Solirubrobacterales bacterium]|nr:glycosyltransferase family 2 protein [Solirubrobacterales bacterium]